MERKKEAFEFEDREVEDFALSSDEESTSDEVEDGDERFPFQDYANCGGEILKSILDPLKLDLTTEKKIAGLILAKKSHTIDSSLSETLRTIVLNKKIPAAARSRVLRQLEDNPQLYYQTLLDLFELEPKWLSLFDYSFAKKKIWSTFSWDQLLKILAIAEDPKFHKEFSEWLRRSEDEKFQSKKFDLFFTSAKSNQGCPTALLYAAFEEFQQTGEIEKTLVLTKKYLLGDFPHLTDKIEWHKFVCSVIAHISQTPEVVDIFNGVFYDTKLLDAFVAKYTANTKGLSPESERFAALADFFLKGYPLQAEKIAEAVRPYLHAHPSHVKLFTNLIIKRTSNSKNYPIDFAIWAALLGLPGFAIPEKGFIAPKLLELLCRSKFALQDQLKLHFNTILVHLAISILPTGNNTLIANTFSDFLVNAPLFTNAQATAVMGGIPKDNLGDVVTAMAKKIADIAIPSSEQQKNRVTFQNLLMVSYVDTFKQYIKDHPEAKPLYPL